jgi:hypothetical protein
MKRFFFYFAATGWAVSLVVHLLSLAGVDVAATVPAIWVLQIGIFVVWLPAIVFLQKDLRFRPGAFDRSSLRNPVKYLKLIFGNIPRPLIAIGVFGFFYAMVNFLVTMLPMPGTPDIKDGHYILQVKGQVIKTLTESEYHALKARMMRGFSGHWLAFYGIAMCLLYDPAFPATQSSGDPGQSGSLHHGRGV